MATEEKLKEEACEEETLEAEAEASEEIAEEAEEVTEEKSELDILKDEIKDSKDKYLRLAAEYDNFRKRTAKEKEMTFGNATAAAVNPFLAVYDNLERAVATPSEDENYKKGVELIFTQFCETLSNLKVEIIDPMGEVFDPNFHNAVMHEESEDFEENTVSEVFQKGFKLGDRVIRPAIVKVAN